MAGKDLINPVDINNPSNKRTSADLLPQYHRTDKNTKFLSSTLDQLIQQPQLERIHGYIGSRVSPTYNPSTDSYIDQADSLRNHYQLNPALVVRNPSNSVKSALGYDDLINQLTFNGAKTDNLDRLFENRIYSYDPCINWDKFINFRQYYWLPTGPDPIEISGLQNDVVSTFKVKDSKNGKVLNFSTRGNTTNPQITLYRGVTYIFDVNSLYPFYVKTAYTDGLADLYSNVSNNGAKNGRVIVTIDDFTPSKLFYYAEGNRDAVGQFIIKRPTENSSLDVETEILGKSTYKSVNGVEFSNGMKIKFLGNVTPSSYLNKEFIVEGVGSSIVLIDYNDLKTSGFTSNTLDPNFDATAFDDYPFDDFSFVPLTPEYITINQASQDQNSWSRYNRWVHEDVIAVTAKANGVQPSYPVEYRAQRPIVEFVAGLQLHNFGKTAKKSIDLIDTVTTDAFNTVEGAIGFYIDQVLVEPGFRIMFNADTDPLVKGRIYEVSVVTINNRQVLNLEEALDSIPSTDDAIVVVRGTTTTGTNWWFNGTEWVYAQQKTKLNQAPLFELYDQSGNKFSDQNFYSSTFFGTQIFGYAVGTGVNDSVLGFPLKYKNVQNVGDYLFNNYFMTDSFINNANGNPVTLYVADGYLKINSNNSFAYKTTWVEAETINTPILQFQVIPSLTKNVQITVIDNAGLVSDLVVDVFVNDVKKIRNTDFTIQTINNDAYVISNTSFATNDRVLFKIYTTTPPNSTGYYEPSIGLTNNPLNGPIENFTFAEITDHVKSITDYDDRFTGVFPGIGNLRDLSNVSVYGHRLVSHGNPLSFAHYFLGNKEHNIINAVRKVANDYDQFKTALFRGITELKGLLTPCDNLDSVLLTLNSNKDTSFSYEFSDMLGYSTNRKVRKYTVTKSSNTNYSLESIFDNTVLSERSVLVYLNDRLLVLGRDYSFEKYEPSINISVALTKGDTVEIHDYSSTIGSYIPPTPTKLGLYPKFVPQLIKDDTYVTPQYVIQGHDGSITIAYGTEFTFDVSTGQYTSNDYRDAVILEYETRVYNNIKVSYNIDLLDINTILPGAFRSNKYSLKEVTEILTPEFLRWSGFYGVDYQTNNILDELNPFTFNYTGSVDSLNNNPLPGFWRAIYKYFFDTDRPHSHPWEMLGFSEMPAWWESQYGPAPYTSGNSLLWNDIETGTIQQGPRSGIDTNYIRTGLNRILPVSDMGELLNPTESGLATMLAPDLNDPNRLVILRSDLIASSWNFGDQGPAETAWRKSSLWPFACQVLMALTNPSTYASLLFDVSRIKKNVVGQYKYGTDEIFLNLGKVDLFRNTVNGSRVLSAGHSVFVIETNLDKNKNYLSQLSVDLSNIGYNLMSKMGGFVSKDKLKVTIDAIDVTGPQSGVLLPQEDYNIIFNVSNPVESYSISGMIVQRTSNGFRVRGYDQYNPYFTIFQSTQSNSDQPLRVGGVSETFRNWVQNTNYSAGDIVFYSDRYYTVKSNHNSDATFNITYYQSLPYLPTKGGIAVIRKTRFSSDETVVPYGTEFKNLQDVYDLIQGYGKWLESKGFVFEEFNNTFGEVIDWNFTGKEFLYWSTQNWAENSIITLSPFANKLVFRSNQGIVDSVTNGFYEYSLLSADALPVPKGNLTFVRLDGEFSITTTNTQAGLFFARVNLIQKEHVILFNNYTLFNDVIYDVETGYRQNRIKLAGFRSADWNGDFFSPGFIFDSAEVLEWTPYTDYRVGETVKFSGNYYSAKKTIPGSQLFDPTQWAVLPDAPSPALLPNFDYKINQFQDFYSLDIDNFDVGQQAMAQHLTGYTGRSYLDYIIGDPIAQYKFYQGMIKEKGTRNTISKLTKSSLNNLKSSIDFNEEWAFRIGYYGGYNTLNEIETPLDSIRFVENPQIIEFVETKNDSYTDAIYYKDSTDIELTPTDFNINSVFPTLDTTLDDNNFQLPTAGYPRFDDVSLTAFNEISILDIANNKKLLEGDTIWLGFRKDSQWDVLRYTQVQTVISAVSVDTTKKQLVMTTYIPHQLEIGELISISRIAPLIDKCYTVQEILSPTEFSVSTILTSLPSITTPINGLIFSFKSSRLNTFDDLISIPYIERWKTGETVWVDNDKNTGKWAVYQKIDNYTGLPFTPAIDLNLDGQFGYRTATSANADVLLVSAPDYVDTEYGRGLVFVLTRSAFNQPYEQYPITLNDAVHPGNYYNNITGSDPTGFGYSLSYDANSLLAVVGAPLTSRVKSSVGGIVQNTGSANNNISQGLVKLSVLGRANYAESTQTVITTPLPTTNSKFGTSVFLSDDLKLAVGSPGDSTNGAVYLYNLSVRPNAVTATIVQPVLNTSTVLLSSIQGIQVGNTVVASGVPNNTTVISVNSNSVSLSTSSVINNTTSITFVDNAAGNKIFINSSTHLDTAGLFALSSSACKFGSAIAANRKLTKIAVSALTYQTQEDTNKYEGAVFVFASTATTPTYLQRIDTQTDSNLRGRFSIGDNFAKTLAMSTDGTYLAIGSVHAFDQGKKSGVVDVYQMSTSTGQYTWRQTLHAPVTSNDVSFGQDLSFNQDGTVLVVSSLGNSKTTGATFDTYTERYTRYADSTGTIYVNDPTSNRRQSLTTFDSKSTNFYSTIKNSGSVHCYNRSNSASSTKWIYGQEITSSYIGQDSRYGNSVAVTDDVIIVGAPGLTAAQRNIGQIFIFDRKDTANNSWAVLRSQDASVDIASISRAVSIDNTTEQIQDYIDIIDPIKGKILGTAAQEITFITSYDPAMYSIGTTGTNVNTNINWLDEHVGELWWDLSTVKYVWYEQGELEYRKSNWNHVFPGSTVDVYEWVRSEYLPSQWSSIADTSAGLTKGISGQPKFVDDTTVSVKQIYNSVSNSFSNVYFFWVKNKTTIPNTVSNRRKSGFEVATEISDPVGSGVKFLAILGPTALMMANSRPSIASDSYSLNIAFETADKDATAANRHTEWLLLQENDPASVPNALLEKKLFDSLIGHDSVGNTVPDPALPAKLKYGIEIRPRQSLFVNRLEALRNLVEYTNSVLSQSIISDSTSFTNLNAKDIPPESSTYDVLLEDIYGLELIPTPSLRIAKLTATVNSNGNIISVTVTDPGNGYTVAPTVTIFGDGRGAVITTVLDQQGRVTSANIVNAGSGYTSDPTLLVRPYSVYVQADVTAGGKWTLYNWDQNSNNWDRIRTQDYDTTLFWKYIDWVDTTYNAAQDVVSTVADLYEINLLQYITVGEYVKVSNSGNGNYIILRKTDGQGGTFDNDWDLVYSQNSTIEILETLWNYSNTPYAFDEIIGYDQTEYDQQPDQEIGYILHALKDDIFVNELKVHWNKLFFKLVRYALTEQKTVDWALKTAFINVVNNSGNLDQRPVYKLQDSQYYEDYIKEIKPYHTKIRKFTEQYTATDLTQSFTTDFDLPAYYNFNALSFDTVTSSSNQLSVYPWKSWNDNYGYGIESIDIADGGIGYEFPPQIAIVPADGDIGSGATAQAFISLGKVARILVTNPGTGYTKSPTVIINGGGSTQLIKARGVAHLGNNPVRRNTIKMKFDRVAKYGPVRELLREVGNTSTYTDTFTANGSATEFKLTWVPTPERSLIEVTQNGVFVLTDQYTIVYEDENYSPQANTVYKKKFATLKLKFIPNFADVIKIEYRKDLGYYNAVDRIEDYYAPGAGLPGRDPAQLMKGIEYPGLRVDTLPLDNSGSWDSMPYGSTAWDNYSPEEGYYAITTSSTATNSYSLPNIIPAGTTTTIYVQYLEGSKKITRRVDGTGTYAVTSTIVGVGTGVVDSIETLYPGTGYVGNIGDVVQLSISAPNTRTGTQARATAIIGRNGALTSATIVPGYNGSGYTEAPVAIAYTETTGTVAYFKVNLRSEFVLQNTTSTINKVTIPTEAFSVSTSSALIIFRNSTSDGTILPGSSDELDAVISGGSINTNTNGFVTANGLTPEQIVLDGSSFLNVYNSYAPEEHLPGQVQETIGISVFSQPSVTYPLIINKKYFMDGLQTTFDLGITPLSTESVIALLDDEHLTETSPYSFHIDFSNNQFVFDSEPPASGWLSLTSMRLGSMSLLDSAVISTDGTTSTSFVSIAGYVENLNAYVTVNGVSTTDYVVTNEFGRARITVLHSTNTTVVQIFVFTGTAKSYSEIKDQVITTIETTSSILLSYPPGNAEPLHSQVIVTKNGLRLNPPVTTYYEVVNNQRLFELSQSIKFDSRTDISRIEVYINGQVAERNITWQLIQASSQILFVDGVLKNGDVVAFVVKVGNDYLIQNNHLVLVTPSLNDNFRITTFTNHDPDFIRTERFKGSSTNRYRMQRPIVNSSYVWVTYNGVPLTVDIDYKVDLDLHTVVIKSGIYQSKTDSIVITSFADNPQTGVTGYKIFKDILGRTGYKRLSAEYVTDLAENLTSTSTYILVNNIGALSYPNRALNIPGSIFIKQERIDFWDITPTTGTAGILSKLRRGAYGTPIQDIYYVGTLVTDQGYNQTVPYLDVVQTTSTLIVSTTTNVYPLEGITFDNSAQPEDQVEVRYGGKLLIKPSTNPYVVTDTNLAFDSMAENISTYAEFSINTASTITSLVLNIELNEGVKLEITRKLGYVWADPESTSNPLLSNPVAFKFLLERPGP
jgi:hypothetical protein